MLPVALPVVPPVAEGEVALVELLGDAAVELLLGEEVVELLGAAADGVCVGAAGVTDCVPCDAVPVWSALFVVLVLPVWLAALLGFCVSTLVLV